MHTCWASQVVLVVKSPSAKARHTKDAGFSPGLGRLPGGGNGNPLQYYCFRNPMDRGPWWATVQRVASLTWLSISAWYVHISQIVVVESRVHGLQDSRLPIFHFPLGLTGLIQHHNSKASVLWCSAYFMVQLLHPYMTTGKTTALMIWIFVSKVMSLLYNMLSRLVIAFLLRNKSLNLVAAVTIRRDFGCKNSYIYIHKYIWIYVYF